MRRSRIGLLLSAVILVVVGSLPGVAMADPTPSGQTSQHDMLAGVLHGEGIVQTKKGPVRVAMQNGTATAATGTSLTIRSADGYTKTWTLAENVKVFDQHQQSAARRAAGRHQVVVGGPITVERRRRDARRRRPARPTRRRSCSVQSSSPPAESPAQSPAVLIFRAQLGDAALDAAAALLELGQLHRHRHVAGRRSFAARAVASLLSTTLRPSLTRFSPKARASASSASTASGNSWASTRCDGRARRRPGSRRSCGRRATASATSRW